MKYSSISISVLFYYFSWTSMWHFPQIICIYSSPHDLLMHTRSALLFGQLAHMGGSNLEQSSFTCYSMLIFSMFMSMSSYFFMNGFSSFSFFKVVVAVVLTGSFVISEVNTFFVKFGSQMSSFEVSSDTQAFPYFLLFISFFSNTFWSILCFRLFFNRSSLVFNKFYLLFPFRIVVSSFEA